MGNRRDGEGEGYLTESGAPTNILRTLARQLEMIDTVREGSNIPGIRYSSCTGRIPKAPQVTDGVG